mgnify:CR=1 FL=1
MASWSPRQREDVRSRKTDTRHPYLPLLVLRFESPALQREDRDLVVRRKAEVHSKHLGAIPDLVEVHPVVAQFVALEQLELATRMYSHLLANWH